MVAPVDEGAQPPPHDIEAEMAVLGSVLLDGETMGLMVPILKAQDFYRPAHASVYGVMRQLYDRGAAIDVVLVRHECERLGILARHGEEVLANLVSVVRTPAHAEHYARIVADHAAARATMSGCQRVIDAARLGESDTTDLLRELIRDQERRSTQVELADVSAFLPGALSGLLEPIDLETGEGGNLPWGIPELDRRGSHMRPGDMAVVAGRPGSGKTMFAANVAKNAAERTGRVVVYCSLEMTPESVARRLLCAVAGVRDPQERAASPEDRRRLEDAAEHIQANVPLHFPSPPREIDAFCGWARQYITSHRPALLVLDYLGLLTGQHSSAYERTTAASQAVRAVALETNCPILALHQMNRGVEREDRLPRMDDLRDSGALEQDAAQILMLHVNKARELKVVLVKSRFGNGYAVVPMVADFERGRVYPQNRGHA